MTTFLSVLLLLVTGVYAYFTYQILRANQQIVSAMRAQTDQERRLRIREHFLAGIAAIAQYDIASPGCEQAMRLLDYYSSLALSSEDPELLHILNTVITAEIRKNIEEIQEHGQEIYVSAVTARSRIQEMLKTHHMQRKGLIPK